RAAAAPKYDPITGELIEPMAVAPAAVKPITPMGGTPARRGRSSSIAYATGDLARHVSPTGALLELFTPPNAMVMLFIFVFHWLLQVTVLFYNVYVPLLGTAVMAFYILAHYGCVVDEIGPDGRDELPRPMRGLSWRDDLFGPFFRVTLALVL